MRAFAGAAHVRVVQADALRFAYDSLYADGYALFANMPYHITTPLLKRLLCDGGAWRSMVLMMQKEAAHRICLGQGRDNGPLSLLAAYYGVCELCFDLPPAAFYPPPAVTSTVIRITRHATPPVPGNIAAIMRIVEAGFAERRKLLANSLAASPLPGGKDDWLAALAACGLPADCRAESLSLTDFAALARWQTAYFA